MCSQRGEESGSKPWDAQNYLADKPSNLQSTPVQTPFRIAVVGGGPRGLSVVERLMSVAHAAQSARNQGAQGQSTRGQQKFLEITVFEPEEFGPGKVWSRAQSREFIMNTPSSFPTVVPTGRSIGSSELGEDITASLLGPLSFDELRRRVQNGTDQTPELAAAERQEFGLLGSQDYPSRALYGAYLALVAERLIAIAHTKPRPRRARGVFRSSPARVEHRRERVVGIAPAETAGMKEREQRGPWTLTYGHDPLSRGESEAQPLESESFDAVVLAVGHVDAFLNEQQLALAEAAAAHGLEYLPPSVPTEHDFSRISSGEEVLIRGLGLNFFDVVTELTSGRGGRFVEEGERLRYVPSGEEPRIVAMSRRGVPYLGKPSFDVGEIELGFCSPDQLELLMVDAPCDFERVVLPLILGETRLAYVEALASSRLEAGEGEGTFHSKSEVWREVLRRCAEVRDPSLAAPERLRVFNQVWESLALEERLDIRHLTHPLEGKRFSNAPEHQTWLLEHLDADAEDSADSSKSPVKHAISAMHRARRELKGFIARGLLTDDSRQIGLRGVFEPVVEFLASGPPARRIAELSALVRSGVVNIMGPDPHVRVDEERGVFTVTSPAVEGVKAHGKVLIEAMMPPNRVSASNDPLMRCLLETGLGCAHLVTMPDGVQVTGSGFAVETAAHELLGADGGKRSGLHVLGLQLSSTHWGTAIAAENGGAPNSGALTIRDAQKIAEAILAKT